MEKNDCKLVWRETYCMGKILDRNLEGNAYMICCERHFLMFHQLRQLRNYGVSAEELKKINPENLGSRLVMEFNERKKETISPTTKGVV